MSSNIEKQRNSDDDKLNYNELWAKIDKIGAEENSKNVIQITESFEKVKENNQNKKENNQNKKENNQNKKENNQNKKTLIFSSTILNNNVEFIKKEIPKLNQTHTKNHAEIKEDIYKLNQNLIKLYQKNSNDNNNDLELILEKINKNISSSLNNENSVEKFEMLDLNIKALYEYTKIIKKEVENNNKIQNKILNEYLEKINTPQEINVKNIENKYQKINLVLTIIIVFCLIIQNAIYYGLI